jgi:hypothetical protein
MPNAEQGKDGRFVKTYGVNEKFLDNIGKEQAWFLGIMASDGCIVNDNLFSVSQSNDEGLKMIEYIKNLIGFTGKIYKSNNAYAIQISSRKLIEKMKEYNIINKKSLTYTFPEKLSPEYHSSFLRGYIDGDGCVTISSNGNLKYNTRYLVLCFVGTEQFIKVCEKLTPKGSHTYKIKNATNCCDLRWNGEKAIEAGKWFYEDPDLYKGKKYFAYKDFADNYTPKYKKYEPKREEFKKLFEEGIKISEIEKRIGIPFQTLYIWKKSMGLGQTKN